MMPVPPPRARSITSGSGRELYVVTRRATPISTARRCASARSPITTMSLGPIVPPMLAASTVTAHSRPFRRRSGRRSISPSRTLTMRSAETGRSAKLEGSPDSLM